MKLRIPYLLAALTAAASLFYLADTPGLKAAPLINLKTIAGEPVNLAVPDGKTRLITFWAPDCPISERNIPSMKRLHERFANDAFEVVAIAMPYTIESDIDAHIEKYDVDYPVAFDSTGEMSNAFPGVRFTPTTFLIDGNGRIVWKHIGRIKEFDAEELVVAALQPQQLATR